MKKIAIIVQKYLSNHNSEVEEFVFTIASILSENTFVDILTTTTDPIAEKQDFQHNNNVTLIKFDPDSSFATDIYQSLHNTIYNYPANNKKDFCTKKESIENIMALPYGAMNDFVKYQDTYSSSLLEYIKTREEEYDKFIFIEYLSPTTYFGIDMVQNNEKILFIPVFLNDISIYFPSIQKYKKVKHLFLTHSERNMVEQSIYKNTIDSEIIGFGITDRYSEFIVDKSLEESYLLYSGSLDETVNLSNLFEKYCKIFPSTLKLYLIGDGHLKTTHKSIIYKGAVSDEERLLLMKNALAIVYPSTSVVLGKALIEAFMMGVPALINAECEILKELNTDSEFTFYYENYQEFENAINRLRYLDSKDYDLLSIKAKDYYKNEFSFEDFKNRLVKLIQKEQDNA